MTRLPEGRAILEIRHAVRAWFVARPGPVVVALSGGADSLALTAAAVAETPSVRALVVDHGLQPGSRDVADAAASAARVLGCIDATVLPVDVDGAGGMEAAARRARYRALDDARDGAHVLVAHTLDDQAETVLLGLARGSGPRSIAGMAEWDAPWGRPLLGVRRAVTRAACVELGLTPFEDPHNVDPDFTRVRLRLEALPLLEDILGGGVAPALARTAAQLREDSAVLDDLADDLLTRSRAGRELDVSTVADAPTALRRRAVRAWLHDVGAHALSDKQLRTIDGLLVDWRGQGGVAVGGGPAGARLVVRRRHGRLAAELEWSLRDSGRSGTV
ncbi:tRNA lysidine(34) synthetase TilS [Rhodococcoides kyotonense]|uniref:tRNA(Ile)-lysidine synthase n=1 Tax=Rhodococcoides kyotonense TaxID=398843 RepID=A0A239GPU6_9NOCA|nr:tRNA lysidine(34) synthetase TilS [Rhodococcus kyotonensis]SNS71229.1 tRNA(Ile)-lysidine synthase [Rhodococcus kyotonensis]